ncbi:MAG: DoxX family protein [Bacteroidales bacterium]|nr:DoxX family protein [Bacteroidales bacterium]
MNIQSKSSNDSTVYMLNVIARWFVGLLFLFSSFVKGVDPLGTAFKIEEYFSAWSGGFISFMGLMPFASFFAMLLITCEFLVGVLLITNSFRRFTAWLLVAMMIFFTFSTALDAFSPTYGISDCGCFGDAVKLTPLQTFLKNIVLDIPTVWILLTWHVRSKNRFTRDSIIAIAAILAMVIFGLYNINNEPCIDFRPWKVGNRMMNTDPTLQSESFTTYQNKQTGESVELSAKELMTRYATEPDFEQNWEWVSSRVFDPHEIYAAGFSMLDDNNNDMAVELIGSEDTLLIATIHHIHKVDEDGIIALQAAYRYASDHNYYMVMLTSALPEDVESFSQQNGLTDVDWYYTDDKAIETMIRSNPGFIMLQDAVILGKWHYNNITHLTKE